MKTLFNTLSSDKSVCISGFVAGFVYTFKLTEKTLNKPLRTILYSISDGILSFLGASVVVRILPKKLKFIIPFIVLALCIYWKYEDLSKS